MSIYCTLWELRFPRDGQMFDYEEYGIYVFAQGVPQHINNVGDGWEFLPPPIPFTSDDEFQLRAVVIVCEDDERKGTERNGQEYVNPLMTLTGEQYKSYSFTDLHEKICNLLQERYCEKHPSQEED